MNGDPMQQDMNLPDIEDLAHEIAQDCLSAETIARYLRSYEKKARAYAQSAVAADRARGWQPIESAPKVVGRIMGAVDGRARFICWGKASHVPMYGWVLTDQGPEDCDLCDPTHWMPLPASPLAPQQRQAAEKDQA